MDNNDNEALIEQLRIKTEDCYVNQKMCCSESIIYALNHALNGGLQDETAMRVGAGFCGGMGANEGCGALNGAIFVLGLLLTANENHSRRTNKKIRSASAELHNKFKKKFKYEKCADLTKAQKGNHQARLCNCQNITGISAELAARIILRYRPELIPQADGEFLAVKETRAGVLVKKIRSSLGL
ncbi:C-GCAxxG-C-C family protein [Desulfobacterota bacterium M19]